MKKPLITFVLLLMLRLGVVGQVSFSQTDYATAYDTNPVATGDFNGDGIIDLAVGNFVDVSILLGNGDGTFKPAMSFPTSPYFYAGALVTGDFNRDGHLDLAIGGQGGCVLLGNGDGSFGPCIQFGAGSSNSTTVGDFNGDGILDIVSASATTTIQLGNGDGTFQPPQPLKGNHGAVISADFNGDGRLDLAFADSSGPCPGGSETLSILLGYGDGTFQGPKIFVGSGGGATSLVAGRFGSNRKILDIAVVNYCMDNTSVFAGKGDGTFKPRVDYPIGQWSWAIASADFNADGLPDLAVSSLSGTLYILLGKTNGTFRAPLLRNVNRDAYNQGITSADFNGDKRPDLALTNVQLSSVSVLLNTTQ